MNTAGCSAAAARRAPGRHRRSCRTACADRCRGPWPSAPSRRWTAPRSPARWRCSSVSSIACAASRSTILVRRSSPYFSASARISLATSFFSFALLLEQRLELLALLGERLLLLADLHLLELRQVPQPVLRISSACSSESLKRFISTGFGSSSRRMMRITSSRLRIGDQQAVEDVQPPGDLVEPVLQAARDRLAVRNSSHSPSSALRPITRGRPSSAMMLRLTR